MATPNLEPALVPAAPPDCSLGHGRRFGPAARAARQRAIAARQRVRAHTARQRGGARPLARRRPPGRAAPLARARALGRRQRADAVCFVAVTPQGPAGWRPTANTSTCRPRRCTSVFTRASSHRPGCGSRSSTRSSPTASRAVCTAAGQRTAAANGCMPPGLPVVQVAGARPSSAARRQHLLRRRPRRASRRLPYLQEELGASAIYLNPVFGAASNHRYDTSDYTQVDPPWAAMSRWPTCGRPCARGACGWCWTRWSTTPVRTTRGWPMGSPPRTLVRRERRSRPPRPGAAITPGGRTARRWAGRAMPRCRCWTSRGLTSPRRSTPRPARCCGNGCAALCHRRLAAGRRAHAWRRPWRPPQRA